MGEAGKVSCEKGRCRAECEKMRTSCHGPGACWKRIPSRLETE